MDDADADRAHDRPCGRATRLGEDGFANGHDLADAVTCCSRAIDDGARAYSSGRPTVPGCAVVGLHPDQGNLALVYLFLRPYERRDNRLWLLDKASAIPRQRGGHLPSPAADQRCALHPPRRLRRVIQRIAITPRRPLDRGRFRDIHAVFLPCAAPSCTLWSDNMLWSDNILI